MASAVSGFNEEGVALVEGVWQKTLALQGGKASEIGNAVIIYFVSL